MQYKKVMFYRPTFLHVYDCQGFIWGGGGGGGGGGETWDTPPPPRICRINLRASTFQNFSRGACPQTHLVGVC